MLIKLDKNLENKLYDSYENGEYNEFCCLIDGGCNPNYVDSNGYSLIGKIVKNENKLKNNIKFFNKLLESNILLEHPFETYSIFSLAIENPDIYYLSEILKNEIDINSYREEYGSCLFECIEKGDINKAKLLLDYNADKKVIKNSMLLLNKLRGTGKKDKVVSWLPVLIEKGIDPKMPDMHGINALHLISSWYDCPELIEFLLKNGVNVNSLSNVNSTALMNAATYDNYQTAASLIENGADINIKDCHGFTAAIKSIRYNNYQILKLLDNNNFDLYSQCNVGRNIAHFMAIEMNNCIEESDQLTIGLQILRKNPDLLFMKDNNNKLPIDYAKQNNAVSVRMAFNSLYKEFSREERAVNLGMEKT